MEDYETLDDSAGALQTLTGEGGWFVLQTPAYTQRSAGLRHAVLEIETSAKDRNLQGAALGYVDMTLKCVQRHQLLRGTHMSWEYDAPLGQSAQLPSLSR